MPQDRNPAVPALTDALVRAFADRVRQRLELKAYDVYLTHDGDLKLDTLIVPKDRRKEGLGTKAVTALTKLADVYGRRVILTPAVADDHHGTTSRARLVRFYKRFGFVENKGRHKDFAISAGMLRPAQAVRAAALTETLGLLVDAPEAAAAPGLR